MKAHLWRSALDPGDREREDPREHWLDLAVRAEAMTCQSCGEEVADYYEADECDECGADFKYDEAAAAKRLRERGAAQ